MWAPLQRLWWFFLPGWGTRGSPDLGDEWRLQAAFGDARGAGELFERLHRREQILGNEVGGLLPSGVVLSHRGAVLFAYASTSAGVDAARSTIRRLADAAGIAADVRVSRWDRYVKAWCQVDPPLSGEDRELEEAHACEAARHETRELSYLVRRLDRSRVEGIILAFAHQRGLDCFVEAERRVLNVRLTFTVSGPASLVDEFADYAGDMIKSHGLPMGAAVGG